MGLLTIHFEHPDFYIVEKPHGHNFHDEGDIGAGFFNVCQETFNQKLFPVHRLDKLTSGLVIVARNSQAANWFQQAFEQGDIDKFYIAISKGKPKKKQGTIIGDMKPARRSQWKLTKTNENPSVTQFFTQSLELVEAGVRMFLVKPQTGKTHQIRVALKSLGTAILGDLLYGGEPSDRGYLHAGRLKFTYNDKDVDVISIPKEGQLFIKGNQQISSQLQLATEMKWPKLNTNKMSKK